MTRLGKIYVALCNNCKTRFAKIFQEDGDYCLKCWQERTHPYIASEKKYPHLINKI